MSSSAGCGSSGNEGRNNKQRYNLDQVYFKPSPPGRYLPNYERITLHMKDLEVVDPTLHDGGRRVHSIIDLCPMYCQSTIVIMDHSVMHSHHMSSSGSQLLLTMHGKSNVLAYIYTNLSSRKVTYHETILQSSYNSLAYQILFHYNGYDIP